MNTAIILAAGESQRSDVKDKNLIKVLGKTVLEYSLEQFHKHKNIQKIMIVANTRNLYEIKSIAKRYQKVFGVVKGGLTRQKSVYSALQYLQKSRIPLSSSLIIHNAANPLIKESDISNSIKFVKKYNATTCCQNITDTIKEQTSENFIMKTLNRNNLKKIQTPQAFSFELLLKAHNNAKEKNVKVNDDAELIEILGEKVKLFKTSDENFKITYNSDIDLLAYILKKKQKTNPTRGGNIDRKTNLARVGNSTILVGVGQDSHRFSKTDKDLILGGYKLKNIPKLEADSDGDVILHALFNAVSSALGGASISKTADSMLKKDNIKDSKKYIQKLIEKMIMRKFQINNLSIAIEAGRPKLEPAIPKIKKSLCKILKIPIQNIGITVTSGEKLTSFGKGEGIQVICYVTIYKIYSNIH